MCLFRKNKIKRHVEEYEQEDVVFKKESSASRIIFGEVSDNDLENAKYVETLKLGHPLCLNFEKLEVAEANKILAFLVGATYALNGKTIEIGKKVYFFVLPNELEDGSVNNWLLQFKE